MTTCVRWAGEDMLLSIRLTPRSSAAKVGGLWIDAKGDGWLSTSVTAPPDKGRANAALIDLLAATLDLPRSSISLEAGATSRLKRIRIARGDAATAQRIEGLT
ncbi:hypothetical protein BH10PSE13_BH10PSE13_24310 [soil metagenome]